MCKKIFLPPFGNRVFLCYTVYGIYTISTEVLHGLNIEQFVGRAYLPTDSIADKGTDSERRAFRGCGSAVNALYVPQIFMLESVSA